MLNAILNPKNPIEAYLTKTLPPLVPLDSSNTIPFVANAEIKLFENGELLDILVHQDEGIYTTSIPVEVKSNVSYHFEVSAEGFPDIISMPELIPENYPIKEVQVQDSAIECAQCLQAYDLIKLIWEADQPHNLGIFFYGESDGDISRFGRRNLLINSKDSYSTCISGETSDELICQEGENLILNLHQRTYYSINNIPFRYQNRSMVVQFLSESYQKRIETSDQTSGIESLFIYPENAYSNIEGGYGIVVGVADTTINIE